MCNAWRKQDIIRHVRKNFKRVLNGFLICLIQRAPSYKNRVPFCTPEKPPSVSKSLQSFINSSYKGPFINYGLVWDSDLAVGINTKKCTPKHNKHQLFLFAWPIFFNPPTHPYFLFTQIEKTVRFNGRPLTEQGNNYSVIRIQSLWLGRSVYG